MRRYLIALLAAAAFIGGMFLLQSYIADRAAYTMQHGIPLSLAEKLLIGLSMFWRNFFWALLPLIVAFFMGVAALFHVGGLRGLRDYL